ncbi:MAG: hypothetical protein ABJA02_04820 [Acidobacteriota bacterium]
MPFRTNTIVHRNYTECTAKGKYEFKELFGFIDHVRSEAARLDADRMLVDCSELDGHVAEVDRFEAGQRVAEVFGPSIKVAVVMAPGTVSKLGEIAAVNRGGRMLVTDDSSEAVKWLAADE